MGIKITTDEASRWSAGANDMNEVTAPVPSFKGMLMQGGVTVVGYVVARVVVHNILKTEETPKAYVTRGNVLHVPTPEIARQTAEDLGLWAEVLEKRRSKSAANEVVAAVQATVPPAVAATVAAIKEEHAATAKEPAAKEEPATEKKKNVPEA